MAGNKHPWRDILTAAEWSEIRAKAAKGDLLAGDVKEKFLDQQLGKQLLTEIGQQVGLYHAIPKDDCGAFDKRSVALEAIATKCADYIDYHGDKRQAGQKSGPMEARDAAANHRHKQITDGIDVWVASLAGRAIKKAEYLAKMKMWHLTTKEKYQNPAELLDFLWDLDRDNTRGAAGEFLHATPYATIEKVDPYHRQTVVLMGADKGAEPRPYRGEMAKAFSDYAMDRPPRVPDPRTRRHQSMSFYEWLEYHPICLGTPGVHGDAKYKYLDRVGYDGHDHVIASRSTGMLVYVRTSELAAAVQPRPLDTSKLPPSSKGPKGSQAFAWTKDKSLLLHPHGGGFVHASFQQGHKIRCSGMLVAKGGKVTTVTDQSGHYAPGQRQIQNFLSWLRNGASCLDPKATVEFEVGGTVVNAGTYDVLDFLKAANQALGKPQLI